MSSQTEILQTALHQPANVEEKAVSVGKQWYVVQARSGFENQVALSLRKKIDLSNCQAQFGEILVPTEEVIEMRGGKKRRSERKIFPGYVLVHMIMTSDAWHLVNSLPEVLGFVGGTSDKPAPISDKEAAAILGQLESGVDKPKPKVLFEAGEVIRVTSGPFADFTAVVEEVDYEKNRLRVAVLIFGRSTPVELEFGQVTKA